MAASTATAPSPGPQKTVVAATPEAGDQTEQNINYQDLRNGTVRARNMVSTAITFGLALMVTIMMMLVTGLFVVNVPTSGAFSGAIDTSINIGSAGFIIMAVSLLVVPVAGLVAYFARSGLGSFLGGGGRGR